MSDEEIIKYIIELSGYNEITYTVFKILEEKTEAN